MDIHIAAGGGAPIFRQIVDQVRLAVMTGRLVEGDQLPSVRALAERLVVNPNTIAKAYAELSREGIIDTQPGRGVFITKPRQIYTKTERARRIGPLLEALVNESLSLGLTRTELVEALEHRFDQLGLPESPLRKGKTQ